MWTLRVAVVVGGIGVDANMRMVQVLKSGWKIVERVALLNCARKRRGVVQFSWELAEGSVRARRTSHDRRPAQGRAVAVQGQYLQRCSSSSVVWLAVYFLQLYLGVCPRLLYFFSVLWKFGYINL
ncbi:hypothetical protein Taro_004840, partial [Colocasia esculenta]|nr:hypothetical protein [Colocasia esculenta]